MPSNRVLGLSLLSYLSSASARVTNIMGTHSSFATASYGLIDSFNSSNFFSAFNFFTGEDPIHGFVDYLNQGDASNQGLINTNKGQIYMGVDSNTMNPWGGRASVRVSSNNAYTHGLFIADIAHMPGSICGVWPTFWLSGPNWPSSGEIDIIEGVNLDGADRITLHTAAGCSVNIAGSAGDSNLQSSDCSLSNSKDGCSATTSAPYGDNFNNIGGGVYAMQWESSGVYVWFFPRDSIPADIQNGAPVTENWGTPYVAFNGGSGCNIDSYFMNQNIVFDTTFCGDWAGNVWGDQCSAMADNCVDYVSGNPGAFGDAYWLINSVNVYQL